MLRQYSILISAALIVACAGCKPAETTQAPPAPDAASAGGHPTETHVHADGTVHAGAEPAADPHAGTSGLTATPALDAQIALHEAEKTKDKTSLAKLYAMRGAERMNDDKSSPRVKYRAALKDFRTALKHDPKNEMAADGKQMIEAIYKSMNRPVPE